MRPLVSLFNRVQVFFAGLSMLLGGTDRRLVLAIAVFAMMVYWELTSLYMYAP